MAKYLVNINLSIEETFEIDDANKTSEQLKEELATKLTDILDASGLDDYAFFMDNVYIERIRQRDLWEMNCLKVDNKIYCF